MTKLYTIKRQLINKIFYFFFVKCLKILLLDNFIIFFYCNFKKNIIKFSNFTKKIFLNKIKKMTQIEKIKNFNNLYKRPEEENTIISLEEEPNLLYIELQKEINIQNINLNYLFGILKINSIENFETFIIETIKQETNLNIYQKISFTNSILLNNDKLDQLKEFYEEECHLSLLNWIWNERMFLKYPKSNINKFFGLLALLINILNIFKILPIKSNDILDLKLFEKLIKIKEFIKKWSNQNQIITLISCVLDKWKFAVEEEYEKKLNKKRNKIESEVKFNNINLLSNKYNNVNIQKNFNNKKVKKNLKIELSKNKVLYFDKDTAPFEVSIIKNQ